MNFKSKARLFILSVIFIVLASFSGAMASSSLNGPSGLIYTPTAYTGTSFGYYSMSGSKIYKFNTALFNNALETGIFYDKNNSAVSYNLKLPVFNESDYMPQVAIGAYNYKNAAIAQTNYIVLSKFVQTFGFTLNFGYLKNGDLKDASKMLNYSTVQDAINDVKNKTGNTFWGLEYAFFPMMSVIGEYQNKSVNAGIRLRPIPVLSIDYDFLDIKNQHNFNKKKVLNFNFTLGF